VDFLLGKVYVGGMTSYNETDWTPLDRWWMRRKKFFIVLALAAMPVFGIGMFNLLALAYEAWPLIYVVGFGASVPILLLGVAALLDDQGQRIAELERDQSTRRP